MANYWRPLALAMILSLIAGYYGYISSLPPPGIISPFESPVFAVNAGALAFCGVTTLQAIWYGILHRRGTAGGLLIAAGALFIFSRGYFFARDFLVGDWADVTADLRELYLFGLIPLIWIVGGVWVLRQAQRETFSDKVTNTFDEPADRGGWPPAPRARR